MEWTKNIYTSWCGIQQYPQISEHLLCNRTVRTHCILAIPVYVKATIAEMILLNPHTVW